MRCETGSAWPRRDGGNRNPEKEVGSWGLANRPSSRLYDAGRGVVGVEETLQNQHGGDLIDDFPVGREGASGGVEMAMGFGGGEALVPEVDGEGKGGAEGFGEGLGLGGEGADIAGEVERMAEDNSGAVVPAEEAAEGAEVLLWVFAAEGEDGLGGQAELVGDGDTDAAGPKIEAEEAEGHRMIVEPGSYSGPGLGGRGSEAARGGLRAGRPGKAAS